VRRGKTRTLSDDGSEVLTTPITLRGQAIGALSFRRPAEAGAWSAQDVALMETTADQVALALENVRLLEEAQQRARQEHVIRQAIDHTHRAVNVEQALRIMAQELAQTMGVPHVSIELGTDMLTQE